MCTVLFVNVHTGKMIGKSSSPYNKFPVNIRLTISGDACAIVAWLSFGDNQLLSDLNFRFEGLFHSKGYMPGAVNLPKSLWLGR